MPRTATKNLSKYRCWVAVGFFYEGRIEYRPYIVSKKSAKNITQYKTKEDCQRACDEKNKKS